jgi:hypothetical protein
MTTTKTFSRLKVLLCAALATTASGADATYAAHFAGGGTVRVGASGFFLIIR